MHNLLPQIIFYVFSGLTVLAAVAAVTQKNPVRGVLFLVLAFLTSAVLWILLEAEFLALILVLVYVGAVMTLFLFVVMMLNIDLVTIKHQSIRYMLLGLLLVVVLVALFIHALPLSGYKSSSLVSEALLQVTPNLSNTQALGMVLYTDYVLAFELAALILLVAIIAAITLVHRSPIRSKTQNIVQQVMIRPEDRVRLVKMKSEPLA